MPRSIWSGAISFGLVTVPIHVVGATEDHSIRFHRYHLADQGRIRTRKVCELEDREVGSDEIGKGYELATSQIVPITDEDLRELPLPTARAIEIVAFVPLASVDPIRIGDGYYLQPDGQVAAKPYKLLRQALARSSKVAVARYAWSGRERLGLLRVRGEAIVLHAMRWPDEIRDPSSLTPPPVEVSEEEIEGALALMDTMTRDDLEGDEFRDTYTEAVAELIEAKREHRRPETVPEPEERPGQVLDLMAALQQSVSKAKESRGEDDHAEGDHAEVRELPGRKKKAPAGKTPGAGGAAKKPAGEKPTGGRATGGKATSKKAAPKKETSKSTAGKKTAAKEPAGKKATTRRPRSA
ncbi:MULTISPECIES: non-homologous end joining protein Ku [Streptomyces]|uniref:non-homologous end joining protein Ku n=1 Tax=Streptomyces TaxID=1883 RepID=UPI000619F818|nr:MULTISPECIES: Ku protein [unclassified Streptomyces]PVD07327.1 Ku protein [Streptomyces sp. CS207]QCR45787.1 Ku protein [Streptomyces sp. SGAir0924]RSS75229.1 Ku protein [Streptomyces sp. WAC06128]GGY68912.1 non-homologous end joining protein Ku [Streptomyces geysiriensis]